MIAPPKLEFKFEKLLLLKVTYEESIVSPDPVELENESEIRVTFEA